MRRRSMMAAALAWAAFLPGTPAQGTGGPAADYVAQVGAVSSTAGEVRKVDREGGKILFKHGPIRNLDMPAMSMVFRVKDRAVLDTVKAGDRVRFSAEKIGEEYTVTRIERLE